MATGLRRHRPHPTSLMYYIHVHGVDIDPATATMALRMLSYLSVLRMDQEVRQFVLALVFDRVPRPVTDWGWVRKDRRYFLNAVRGRSKSQNKHSL